ncbi:MAG: anthranilate phosphoribosyltransferase [Micromonosporaceae bacterium]
MADRTWPHLISTLLHGDSLSDTDTAWAMTEIMAGEATPAQIAGFVVALRAKGETATEVAGFVEVMLANAARVTVDQPAVDVVGTGGDRAHTVNISTMAAIVTAGAGIPVVKHGNRAASSSCGTADVLEQLGVPLDLTPEAVSHCVEEAGIGFCFAPKHHPGMRHAGVPRKEMGVPTVFNFLGPLCNPAQPTSGAVGCAELRMAPVMAEVFARRGHSVLVMRGEDGLDEFTTTGPTRLWVVTGGTVREELVDAADLGLPISQPGDLRGGDPEFNAEVVRRLLAGEPGPVRDAVLVNAAAAIAAFTGLDGDLADSLRQGLQRATEAVDSGAAAAVLDRWIGVAEAAKLA